MHLSVLYAWLWSLCLSFALCQGAWAVDFGQVMQMAGELAGRPHKPAPVSAPEELRKLTFQQHQSIRMKPDRALWHRARTQFEVSFVHMGMSFDRPVIINEVSADGVRRIEFDSRAFDYGDLKLGALDGAGSGFAGFRVHFPLHGKERKDEVLVFAGASYFRALAEGLRYGLAARGLAIDTGEASGEEFPRFVEFWVNRPAPGDQQLVIHALLDSRRVTGAYRFVLKPGAPTRMEVRARLFLREKVSKLGIAPFTSMFFYGENQPPPSGSARPEVHDSDGLSVQSRTGEWLWRPLLNPRRLLITSFVLTDPVGFGLMQRDRTFRSYEDLDARFDLKPSAWVVPKGKWGDGRVELVQIPSPDETNDNIVAYWIPAIQPQPRKPWDIEYELLWGRPASLPAPSVRVTQTRRLAPMPAERKDKGAERNIVLVVDFEPLDPDRVPPDLNPTWNVSSGDNGEILERTLRRHEATGGWRASVRIRQQDDKRPIELRGQLNAGSHVLSEVWSYIVPPE
jgi:periplasmic glucans biosynthesis protein